MIKEKLMHAVFFIAACTSILAVALICLFLFANGIPAIQEIGVFKFLLGTRWKPGNNIFGILPMIMGSIYVTAGAIIIGVPIGIMTSIFMAEYCPRKIYGFLKSATELLAGIPSVVYGFFGLTVLVPLIRKLPHSKGTSILTASILLGIMILPTIIGVTEAALRAVPRSYYEGSLALGATQERSIFRVMLPAAKSGVAGRRSFRHRPGHRRDHGRGYGSGKPGENAGGPSERRPDHDDKHCPGDGLCGRPSQRRADCHRRCAFCIHSDY